MTNSTDNVIKNIKFYRVKNNFTQEKLSELAGITVKYLSEIERGKKQPSIDCIKNLAHALNINLFQIFL